MNGFETDIENCLRVLHEGGIFLYPTDTIWGIGCDATNARAVEKILQLKQRPPNKSFVVLTVSEREVLQYVATVDLSVFDFIDRSPTPITVIYDNAIGFADNILADDGSVAIRICKDEFCRHLIKRFQKPIVSTSANISGMSSPALFHDISTQIISGVDYIVKYRQDDNKASIPSSIIKWNNGKIEIIR